MAPPTDIDTFRANLYGAWRVVSDGSVSDTNPQHRTYLLGVNTTGFIFYTPDGHMGTSVSGNLPPIRTAAQLWAPLSDADAAACARSYVSYAGRFELREISEEEDGESWVREKEKARTREAWLGILVHCVEVSLFPNWVGTRQHRVCSIDSEGLLTLTVRDGTERNGEVFRSVAKWKKA